MSYKLQVIKINEKYKVYSVNKNIKKFIPSHKLPLNFVRILMKNNKFFLKKKIKKNILIKIIIMGKLKNFIKINYINKKKI